MITELDIPAAWTNTLLRIRSVFPSAVLAGGALRDLAMGGPVKDLDIFVEWADTEHAPSRGYELGLHLTSVIHSHYLCGAADEVHAVEVYSVPGVPTVQVIYLCPPSPVDFTEYLLDRVDFDACQAAWDGKTLTTTPGFLKATQTHHFTLNRCESESQLERSYRRAEAFVGKYPDLSFDMTLGAQFNRGFTAKGEQLDMFR